MRMTATASSLMRMSAVGYPMGDWLNFGKIRRDGNIRRELVLFRTNNGAAVAPSDFGACWLPDSAVE